MEFAGESGVAGNGENPTLTLETGTRYVVKNGFQREDETERELDTNAEHGTDTVLDEWAQQLQGAGTGGCE